MRKIVTMSFILFSCLCITYAQAANMGEIQSGETRTGTISSVGQIDLWAFQGIAGDRVVIDVESQTSWFDTELILIGPNGDDEITTKPGGDLLDHRLAASGTYTIIVEDLNLDNAGDYALTFMNMTRGPLASSGDQDGGAIASGQTISGSIAVSDMDGYQFTGQVGDRVVIDIESQTSWFDTEIILVRPDGNTEVTTNPGGDLLDHRLAASGTYTIIVEDLNLDNAGDYTLTFINLTRGPLSSSGDSSGGFIASGQTISGSNEISDMDGYQFAGQAGDRVVIDVESQTSWFDTELILIGPNGDDEITTKPGGDLLDHRLAASGTYTIIVEDLNLDNAGNYTLTFTNLSHGSLSYPGDCDGGLIAVGETINGKNGVSDMDGYQFYGQADDRVLINAKSQTSWFDTELILVDPDGENETATTNGGDSLDYTLKKRGLYTIIVEDLNLDNAGDYTITFNKFPMTQNPGIYNPTPAKGCNISSNQALIWNAVTGATGYDVYMAAGITTQFQIIASDILSNSLIVNNIDKGTIYYWKVVAHTPGGDIQGTVNWFMSVVPCDLNGDCRCDMRDWLLFGQRWGATNCSTVPCACDLNGDGRCDMRDWLLFGKNWGFNMCP